MLAACASVPQNERFLSAGIVNVSPQKSEGVCTELIVATDQRPVAITGLSQGNISLFDWNIYKGSLDGWESDFLRLTNGKDIILLQEASLDKQLQDVLQQQNLYWNLKQCFSLPGARDRSVACICNPTHCKLRSAYQRAAISVSRKQF